MEIAVLSLISAIAGAVIGAAVTLFNAHRQRRTEIDALVLSAAFGFAAVEWRGHIDVSIAKSRGAKTIEPVLPPVYYLFNAIEIARASNKGPLTAAEIERIRKTTHDLIGERRKLSVGGSGGGTAADRRENVE